MRATKKGVSIGKEEGQRLNPQHFIDLKEEEEAGCGKQTALGRGNNTDRYMEMR